MTTLLDLLLTFAYLALISVGGGATILPEMERQVVNHHWLSHADFVEIFALSQLVPGPNMLLVFLIGYRVAALPGALAAGIGMFTPTSCLLAGLAWLTQGAHPPKWIERFHAALEPISIGLIAAAAWTIGQDTVTELSQMIICGVATIAIAWGWLTPAVIILLAVVFGIGKVLFRESVHTSINTQMLTILLGLTSFSIVLMILLHQNLRSALMRDSFDASFRYSWEYSCAPRIVTRDRPPPQKGIMTVLLLLLVGQNLVLLWTYRNIVTKAFTDTTTAITRTLTDTTTAIARHIPRPKGAACKTSSLNPGDRTTYLQVCHTMQDVLNVPNGQFFYGGTMGAAALRANLLKEIQVAHPNFRLRYLEPLSAPADSSTGITMLLNGELSFAESQRPLREREYQQAKDRGFILRQIPVALTGAAFYTHPDLALPGLSLAQLQAIYTGKLTHWKEIGGPDLPIIPVSQEIDATGSTLSLLLRELPSNFQGGSDRRTLAKPIQSVRDTPAAIRKVADTPGAIGFAPQAIVANQSSLRLIGLAKGQSRNYIQPITPDGKINTTALQDSSYPLIQRVFVVVRQDGTLDEMAGIAYASLLLSEKGQSLMAQAGYFPLRFNAIESR